MTIQKLKPLIICICESWLSEAIPTAAVEIADFNCYRKDANGKEPSGGVLIYTHRSLRATQIKIPENIESYDKIEWLLIKIQYEKCKSFYLAVLYNHPPVLNAAVKTIGDFLYHLCSLNNKFYVIGDYNIDMANSSNGVTKKLANKLEQLNLKQTVSEFTRISEIKNSLSNTTSISKTMIDLCVTNNPDTIISTEVDSLNPIADHNNLVVNLNVAPPKKAPLEFQTFRCLKNYSPEILQENLVKNGLINCVLTDDANLAAEIFTNVFNATLDSVAPFITKRKKPKESIKLSDDAVSARKTKVKLYNKACASSLSLDWDNYRNYSKLSDSLIIRDKKKETHSKILKHKDNPKKLWKTLNQTLPRKSTSNHILDSLSDSGQENEFNCIFNTTGKKIYDEISKTNAFEITNDNYPSNANFPYPEFKMLPVSISDVIRTIKCLKNSNSEGIDKINTRFLKDSLPVTALIITQILNLFIETNCIPELWKTGVIIPIYKGGELIAINFRPITLLPVISKVLEKLIVEQLLDFLESNRILNSRQYGFRKKSSVSMALLGLNEKIYTALDQKRLCIMVLVDLSKAFDSIPHKMLLDTLIEYNIKSELIKNYLNGRKQMTKIGKNVSNPADVTFGVPQGSVMGPVLFNIYINNIQHYIKGLENDRIEVIVTSYADDTQLLFIPKSNDVKFEELKVETEKISNKLISLFGNKKLKINLVKTQVIMLGSQFNLKKIPENERHLILNNQLIKFSKSVNNLGIHYDEEMKFDQQTNVIFRKIFNSLIYINKCRVYFTYDTRKLLVETLAFSQWNYCREVWCNQSVKQEETLEKLLKFGARIVYLKNKRDHTADLIKELKWLRVSDMDKFSLAVATFKITHGKSNPNVVPAFGFTYYDGPVRTRSGTERIIAHKPNTRYGDRIPSVRASKLWDKIPTADRKTGTVSSFKKCYKRRLLAAG